jgi:hypothetical protein
MEGLIKTTKKIVMVDFRKIWIPNLSNTKQEYWPLSCEASAFGINFSVGISDFRDLILGGMLWFIG